MSDYDETKKKLRLEIQNCHMLKEAQVPDSAHAYRYQDRVTALTDALHKYERDLPRLRVLDQEIRVAQFDLEAAYRSVQAGAAPFPKAAAWTGGLGAVGLFASLRLDLSGFVTAGSIGLGLLSGLCVVLAVRRKRVEHDDLYRARTWLADLVDERETLLPPDVDDVIENAGKVTAAVTVPVVDDRPTPDRPNGETKRIELTDGAST